MTEAMERYEILGEAGRGGMAVVYRAFDKSAEMEVAIKVLQDHLAEDEAMIEAFGREADLMQAVDHPGVAKVYAQIQWQGRPAIVMEYCSGGELRHHLLRQGPLAPEQAQDFMTQILEALAAIHDQGIVHRDIKPHNILFAQPISAGDTPQLKLIDFGIGQAQELMATDESGQVGTVEYMAPERVDGFAVDGRSDLYSAAILFFEMVCGHVPYRGDSAAVISMHRDAPVPDPSLFAKHLREPMHQVITQGLAKHPEERFDSARQMQSVLQGGQRPTDLIDAHPRWRALNSEFEAQAWMGAPVDTEGQEWILFSPARYEDYTHEITGPLYPVVREMIDEYSSYLTVPPDRVATANENNESPRIWQRWLARLFVHPNKSLLLAGAQDEPLKSVVPGAQALQRLTIARGLSRDGLDHLIARFEAAGAKMRYARLPRHQRETPRSSWLFEDGAMGAIAGVMGIYGLAAILPMVENLDTDSMLPIYLSVIAFSAMAAFGAAQIPLMFGKRRRHRPGHALFDFCRPQKDEKNSSLVAIKHLELAAQIQSPRVAASFKRALNLALHLQDRLADHGFDDRQRVSELVDSLSALARQIIALEKQVAAIRPGRLASRIRRLDLQIAAAEDMDTIDELMDQKQSLRHQLEARDQDQLRLEEGAQKLLDLTARMEAIVVANRPSGDDDKSAESAESAAAVVLDLEALDALDASIKKVERRVVGDG